MVYNRNLHDDAYNLFKKATKRSLMGRFDEARKLAQEAIDMLEASNSENYCETLAGMYFFIENHAMFRKYTRKEIKRLKEPRRKYARTNEANHYGSRYLDACIDRLEKSLIVKQMPYIDETSTLVAFDLAGTLLQMKGYSWEYISKMLGVDKKKERKLEAGYRKGRIDYSEWASQILELYKQKGLNKKHLEDLVSKIVPVQGARETIDELKKRGKKIALLSGSLDFLVNAFFPEGTFDYIHINKVHFNSTGKLSTWETTKYGSDKFKAEGLREICEPRVGCIRRDPPLPFSMRLWDICGNEEIDAGNEFDFNFKEVFYPGHKLHRTIYVGDNDNDVEVAKCAGMAIAVNSESKELKSVCEVSVDGDLRSILDYIA